MPSFALSELPDGAVTIVAARGEIDVATTPVLARRLASVLRSGRTRLVVDLTETGFLDATGLAVLLSTLRRVRREDGRLAIACANPTVLRLFEITKTASSFAIFPSRAAAVAHAGEGPGVVVAMPAGRAARSRASDRRARVPTQRRPRRA